MAFVHHTAGSNSYTRAEAPALVRGVYAYHTKALGWSDIGYNFLIDRFGTIYVGRAGGPRQGVVGAHTYGFNTGSCGVSLMGTYTTAAPSAAALASLEQLLAWKPPDLHGVDPTGTASMTVPPRALDKYKIGTKATFPVIAGHRDANYTACPGDVPLREASPPAQRCGRARQAGGASPRALRRHAQPLQLPGRGW